MILFWGSHGVSSTVVMQPEEPVRQELQFYYVVSYDARHLGLTSFHYSEQSDFISLYCIFISLVWVRLGFIPNIL